MLVLFEDCCEIFIVYPLLLLLVFYDLAILDLFASYCWLILIDNNDLFFIVIIISVPLSVSSDPFDDLADLCCLPISPFRPQTWPQLRCRSVYSNPSLLIHQLDTDFLVSLYFHVLLVPQGLLCLELLSSEEAHHPELLLIEVEVVVFLLNFRLEVQYFLKFP